MSDGIEQAKQLELVEGFIRRNATPEEAEALYQVLGLKGKSDQVATLFSPDLPPEQPVGVGYDMVAHAERRVAKLENDETEYEPRERERLLKIARRDLERLRR